MNTKLFTYGVITGIASVCALIWLILNFGQPCTNKEIKHEFHEESSNGP